MTTDEIIDSLLAKIEQAESEIASCSRPQWRTSCTYGNDSSPKKILIQTIQNKRDLCLIYAEITAQEVAWEVAYADLFNLDPVTDKVPELEISGYKVSDWKHDLKLRANILEVNTKKSALDNYKKRLDSLVSPEKRREIELKKIQKELGL